MKRFEKGSTWHPNGKRLPNLGGRFSFSPSGPDPYRLNDSSPLPRTLNKAVPYGTRIRSYRTGLMERLAASGINRPRDRRPPDNGNRCRNSRHPTRGNRPLLPPLRADRHNPACRAHSPCASNPQRCNGSPRQISRRDYQPAACGSCRHRPH